MVRAYFDNNANTPVLPEILEAMLPALQGAAGNASSIHQRGQAAKAAIEQARAAVADLIGAMPTELVFTSGGTESNNLAIRGVVEEWIRCQTGSASLPHLITSRIEHHAVLNVFEDLERAGHPVTYLAVGSDGRVDRADVAAALRPDTALISVMMANNETGVVQPVAEIGAIARAAKVTFHVDAVQAVGRVAVRVKEIGCDLLSLSGHKIHASMGIGALYVGRRTRLRPQLLGGHHERDRRAGTENVPGIMSLGAAAHLAQASGEPEARRLAGLRNRLEAGILASVPHSGVVGAGQPRVANTSNMYFDGIEGEALVIALDLHGFCVSTGAACSSGAVEPSHVLLAMGMTRRRARSCLRFSLGRQNTVDEVEGFLEILPGLVERLRRLSPVEASTLVQSA
ncbi:MAG TPA: cysteine desulfurase family protein [Terriglobales bacterium]|nr:cysteine desulfurase family protein [Terriglobales bacterium]